MSTPQPNPKDLAKQGDRNAIALLLNRSLQSKGVTARIVLKDDYLQVMLESDSVPDRKTLVPFVRECIEKLEITSVNTLKIYGRQTGNSDPSWNKKIELQKQVSLSPSAPVVPPPPPRLGLARQKQATKEQTLVTCKGENGALALTEAGVTIKRTGGLLSAQKKGEKHILYTDIVDFQYQKSNLISLGYIYLRLSESPEEITLLDAYTHENAVTFLNNNVEDFEKAKEILIQKVNPQKYDNIFEGRSGTLILTETGIVIERRGGFLSSHPAGKKSIPYSSITAVQFKKADITVGFIQFTLQGGVEARGGAFEAVSDENTITFGTEEKTKEFEKAKIIIEEKIVSINKPNPVPSQMGDLEQLEKLASLKDKGIISEEEFQAKKKQILGLD